MRRIAVVIEALTSLVFAVFSYRNAGGFAEAATGSQLNPCAAPNEIAASFEETAWRIWVAATCPSTAINIRLSSGRTG
jgi:hypothetical protein